MADLIKVAQVVGEAEYTATALIKAAQVFVEAEHTIYDRVSIAQIFVEVEYSLPSNRGSKIWVCM